MIIGKFETFVAHKLLKGRKSGRRIRPVVFISILAIALSSAVMILTASVIRGYKTEVSQKVIGFGSHIVINHFESRNSYETRPIPINPDILKLEGSNNIARIETYVSKPAIIKHGDYTQANILKGVDPDFDLEFYKSNLTSGTLPDITKGNEILLSKSTADAINAEVGDDILIYFIQDPPRIRKLTISGTYASGFAQFDDLLAVAPMSLLQQINGWEKDQISGYEVLVKDYKRLDETADFLYGAIPHQLDARTIEEKHPDIFNWLELQDVNYIIIIGLMVLVAAINAISALLILILEKTTTIGILKAIGSNNTSIRRVFILMGSYLLVIGLVIGNIIGLGIAFIQDHFQLITLPVESYYLSAVPIRLNPTDLFMINFGTIIICTLALIFPSHIISRIQVIKVLKFD